jgi:hypothetical protein
VDEEKASKVKQKKRQERPTYGLKESFLLSQEMFPFPGRMEA